MRIAFAILFVLLALTEPVNAATKRILVVGDSWAAGMTHPMLGKVFQTTLEKNGYKDALVVATDKTAMPGSQAANWASNHEGKLDNLKKTLEANPSIDIVFVVIGGNDFLQTALKTNLAMLSPERRAKKWKKIAADVQTVANSILAVRPNLKVVLSDYDYLNIEKTAKSFLKWNYNGISQEDFNKCFVELGREKLAVAKNNERCFYVQNWGVLQNGFADKPKNDESEKLPLPGGPPTYDPYPGGDLSKPSPAEAFTTMGLNDGIHPNAAGYRLIIENALRQGLGDWLRGTDSPSDAEIKNLLRDHVENEKRSPGIVVGIIDANGSRVFSHGKTRADSDNQVNGDTIFQIGSVTKTFTTLLLQQMIDRGDVQLNEPIAKLLPASVKIPLRNGREITLRDLATHTSGLPRMPFKKPPPPGTMPSVTMEQVFEFLSDYELPRDIGSQYEYSNLGVGLLGHALALKAGTNYEALIVKQICNPLKMEDTRITLTSKMKTRLATAHDRAGKPIIEWHQPTLLGAGAISSSANDLLKYVSAQLGLAPSPLYDAMAKTQASQAKALRDTQVALGWHIRKMDGAEVVSHNGSTLGYRSSVVFDKKKRCGVVVLMNSAEEMGDLPFKILKQLSAR